MSLKNAFYHKNELKNEKITLNMTYFYFILNII
jgi:hypothetical protein